MEAKTPAAQSTDTRVTHDESEARISAYERRIAREQAIVIQSSSTAPHEPAKQGNEEIMSAGHSAVPELSTIAKQYENARPAPHKPEPNLRESGWIPIAETTTVAARDIGGMIYVGTPPSLNRDGHHDKCRVSVLIKSFYSPNFDFL